MVNQKAFLTALKILPRLEDMRLYLQIERGVCSIEANYWDTQVSIGLESGAASLPRCCPDFKQLIKAVERASDTLVFSLEDQLVVSSSNMTARVDIKTNDVEYFHFPTNDTPIKIPRATLGSGLAYANKIKATKDHAAILNKVRLDFEHGILESTDGHIGCNIPLVVAENKIEKSIQIPGFSSEILSKILSKLTFDRITIYCVEDKIHVCNYLIQFPFVSFHLMFDRLPQKYPNLQDFFSRDLGSQWVVDRQALLDTIKGFDDTITLSFGDNAIHVQEPLSNSTVRVEAYKVNSNSGQNPISFDPKLLAKILTYKSEEKVTLCFISEKPDNFGPMYLTFDDGTRACIMPTRQ